MMWNRSKLAGRLARVALSLAVLLLPAISAHGSTTPTTPLAADLQTMVLAAQSRGVAVLIAKLTPVSSTYDSSGVTAARINALNTSIDSLASALGLGGPVDLFGAFAGNASLIGGDGLHPTDAGYTRIAETFYSEIVGRYGALR